MIKRAVTFYVLVTLCLLGLTTTSYSFGNSKEGGNQLAELPSFHDKKEDDHAWIDPYDPDTVVFSVKTADLREPKEADSDTYTTPAISMPIGKDVVTFHIRWRKDINKKTRTGVTWKEYKNIDPIVVAKDQTWVPMDSKPLDYHAKWVQVFGDIKKAFGATFAMDEFHKEFSKYRWFDLYKTQEGHHMLFDSKSPFYLYPRYQYKPESVQVLAEAAKWNGRPLFDLTIIDESDESTVLLKNVSFKEKYKMYDYDGLVMDGVEYRYGKKVLEESTGEKYNEVRSFESLRQYSLRRYEECSECQNSLYNYDRNSDFWRNYKKLRDRENTSEVIYFKVKLLR